MHRTQIYLTETQVNQLSALARRSGRKQSVLVRQAIDSFIKQQQPEQRAIVRKAAAGLWRHRDDAINPAELRKEWDRPA